MKVLEEGIAKKISWTTDDNEDVSKARSFFVELTRQGWLAVKKNGDYKRVLEFKPEYGELMFIPLVEGGM